MGVWVWLIKNKQQKAMAIFGAKNKMRHSLILVKN
jgi:hypothetical protein